MAKSFSGMFWIIFRIFCTPFRFLIQSFPVVTGHFPTDPQSPESSKTREGDSKVTFGLSAKVTQNVPKSESKVTKTVQRDTFEPLLSNF